MYLEEFPLLLKTSGNLDLFLIQSTQLKNVAKTYHIEQKRG